MRSPLSLTLGLIDWRNAAIEAVREGEGPGCHEETRPATPGESGTETDEGDGGRGVAGGAAGGVLALLSRALLRLPSLLSPSPMRPP